MAGFFRNITIGGFEKLRDSFRPSVGAAEHSLGQAARKEIGAMGAAGALLLSPILVPLNAVAHGAAVGVKGYRGAFRRAPVTTSLVTAAIAVPTALGVMHAGKKHSETGTEQKLEASGQKLQETGHVLGVLEQAEPPVAVPQQPFSSMQLAPTTIQTASANAQGTVVAGREAAQAAGV